MMNSLKSVLEKTNRRILKILCETRLNYQRDINISNKKNVLLICNMGNGKVLTGYQTNQ